MPVRICIFISVLIVSFQASASNLPSFGNNDAKILSYCIKVIDNSVQKNRGRAAPFISYEETIFMNKLRRDMVQGFTNNQDFIKFNYETSALIQPHHEIKVGREASDAFFRKELEGCKSKMSAFTNTPQETASLTPPQNVTTQNPPPASNIQLPSYKSQAYLDRLDHCIMVAKASQFLQTGTSGYGNSGAVSDGNTYSTKWDAMAEEYSRAHNLRRINQTGQQNADFRAMVANGGTAVINSEFRSCKDDLASATNSIQNENMYANTNQVSKNAIASALPAYASQDALNQMYHCVTVASSKYFVEMKNNGNVTTPAAADAMQAQIEWNKKADAYAITHSLRKPANLGPHNNAFRKQVGRGEYGVIPGEYNNCKSQLG